MPTGLANVVAIAAGIFHNLALKNNGTVVAWGDNSRGQTNVPTGLSNVVAVAAGDYHSLALAAPPPPNGVYDFEDNTFQGWEPFFIFNGIAYSGQPVREAIRETVSPRTTRRRAVPAFTIGPRQLFQGICRPGRVWLGMSICLRRIRAATRHCS